jgi:hypothetical protein
MSGAKVDPEDVNWIIKTGKYFSRSGWFCSCWIRLSTGEAQARIAAERNNPQASIWVGGVGLDHIAAKKAGLTMVYNSKAAAKVPKQFKEK